MTTELATNAVVHVGHPYEVAVQLDADMLRVEVRDASAALPTVRAAAPLAARGGRGLALLSALADRWGSRETTNGKTVWFEMHLRGPRG
jgi:anti-sigma regulatory factor (Ser/Thr protein kinase)